jgi:hypothetical protein
LSTIYLVASKLFSDDKKLKQLLYNELPPINTIPIGIKNKKPENLAGYKHVLNKPKTQRNS